MKRLVQKSSQLKRNLHAGHFAVTAETTPKTTTDLESVLNRVLPLKNIVDAVNITDGAGAKAHLSSLVVAGSLIENGIEPILQLTLRDRNKIALQSDVLGAASLGVSNILVLTGDPVEVGEEIDSKFVRDFETSNDLLALLVKMRDEGKLNSGRDIINPPQLFLGSADAPFDPPIDWKPKKIESKLNAGADFFQTQYCFDMDVCRRYFSRLTDYGILEKTYFLVGLGSFSSLRQAHWMNDNLPGVFVPDELLTRLERATDQKIEGAKVCIELLQQLKEIPGVAGAHIMGPGQEQLVGYIVAESGVLDKRQVSKKDLIF